jgi:hypothetical protein
MNRRSERDFDCCPHEMPSDALTEALARWDAPDRPVGWNSGDEHHLACEIITVLRAVVESPTTEDREALARLSAEAHSMFDWDEMVARRSNGDLFAIAEAYKAADAILAGFRLPAPVTDEEVEAAARSNYQFQNRAVRSFVPDWTSEHPAWRDAYREEARAALEAAREASR